MSRRKYFIGLGDNILREYDRQIALGRDPEVVSATIIAQEQKKLLQRLVSFKKKVGSSTSNDNKDNIKTIDQYIKDLPNE